MTLARLARERVSFGKLREVKDLPNLIEVQTESFQWFLEDGVAEVLRDISPIEDFTGQLKLELTDHVFDPPKHSEEECRERDMTYARPLFVTARFMNSGTGEIKEQTVFMGDFPMMTDRGTFIINGTERIVVSQLVRSPGVYFGLNPDKTAPEKDIADAKMIPGRGAWLEFEIDKKDVVYVRIDRKRKQPVTVLLKALEFGDTDEALLGLITDEDGRPYESIRNTLEKDHTESADDAFIDIYRKLRPGEPPTPDSARQLLTNLFFNPKRYDLAKVGRHKVTKKLRDEYPKMGLNRFGLETPTGDVDAGSGFTLTKADILAAISYLVKLHANEPTYYPDDIDHFGNRRVRSVGELIQNQVRVGLSRMERVVRERMTTQDVEAITPQTLINIRPVVAAIKEFFGSSQLSQFMDQTNPLAGLTHKRRLSALGPGGLSRERAGFEVRDVHPSHYGRMCPIETPEGPNIGLIGYLASFARINRFGFIETPYRKVVQGRVTDEIVYLAADDEDTQVIAQANASVDESGRFQEERVLVRAGRGEIAYVPPSEIHYMDVSPKQIVSVATALIPFLEHDDANRALMGANMQRQAVPLLRATAPFIGTGIEARAARDAGDVVLAEDAGTVVDVARRHGQRRLQDARQEVVPAAEVPPVEPGHLHQPEARRHRRRHREEGRCARRRAVDTPGRARVGQEPARRVHAVEGPQLRGRHRALGAARAATTCSPRSTSRSTRSTPATRSSAPRRSRATSRTSPRTSSRTSTSAASSASEPRSAPATSSSARSRPRARPS